METREMCWNFPYCYLQSINIM
uniref:Uncharacterized protein n=1 Tax=Rhizophora mucronata TaxID=61149 RepID=A0A2P2N7V2_RHIMU